MICNYDGCTQRSRDKGQLSRAPFLIGFLTTLTFIVYSIATIFILAFVPGAYPESALECFHLIHHTPLVALIRLDLLSMIVVPLYLFLFYGIYYGLKSTNDYFPHIAFFLIFAGITIFMSNIHLSSLFELTKKYMEANDPIVQERFLAAGEAVLANDMWHSSSAKYRGILVESGALILCILMRRSSLFNKITFICGILAHSFDLASEILSIFISGAKALFSVVAGPLYIIWFISLAIDFYRLSVNTSTSRNLATGEQK